MSFLSGAVADWVYALALLVLGFVLVLLEVFVIPGVNIFGIVGFLTICAGVGYAFVNMGLEAALAVAGLGVLGTAVLVRLMIKMKGWQRLILQSSTSRTSGYDSVSPGRETLLGQRGEALTPLRPAGRGQFGEQVVDVVSEGGFIARGERIEVLAVHGNRVVVGAVRAEEQAQRDL